MVSFYSSDIVSYTMVSFYSSDIVSYTMVSSCFLDIVSYTMVSSCFLDILYNGLILLLRHCELYNGLVLLLGHCELRNGLTSFSDIYQHLKERFGNKKSVTSLDVPAFESVFEIGKLEEQLQGRGNTIRKLKEKISRLQKKHSEADPILDFKALDSQNKD
ncbi:hypothetical protein Tco_1372031 [Tanacetum coccineum]